MNRTQSAKQLTRLAEKNKALLDTQASHFEERYQNLIAQFYRAQADFSVSHQECSRLRSVVHAKQEVINVLLPYYPHSLTPELQYRIALT